MLDALRYLTWQDVILAILDVAIVAYLFYRVFLLIRGTRAVQLLVGIAILLVLVPVTEWLRLYTANWLLVHLRTMLMVALPIVFHPELRRALEHIGRGRLFGGSFLSSEATRMKLVDEVVRAAFRMSANRVGALIVFERQGGLGEYMEDAVPLDAVVTAEFLENIFVPNTPLHDGAVIIRGDRAMAAACFLPTTQELVGAELGSRHRAALGITQVTDAVAVVVSEETGTVSLGVGGRLIRGIDAATLREKLLELLGRQPVSQIFRRGSLR